MHSTEFYAKKLNEVCFHGYAPDSQVSSSLVVTLNTQYCARDWIKCTISGCIEWQHARDVHT
jgi:hypothetical protein